MSYASRFCQMKYLIKIYIWGNICGCEVKNFQSCLYWFSIHEMAPFMGFWALTPQNIVQSYWNFEQRLSFDKTNAVFENSFKVLNFSSEGTHPKFTVLVHFGAQFIAGKPRILLKTTISPKAASLGISNNLSPRSQRNHKIFAKLSKNSNIFCAQIGSKLPPGAASEGYQKFSHSQ